MAQWYKAKLIRTLIIAKDIKALWFKSSEIKRHIPGQYYSIRLVNSNNYISERLYSAANVPNDDGIIELGVQRIPNGEISPFLYSMKVGTEVEITNPSGKYFNFEENTKGPIFFICAGVGVVPIMSMIRSAKNELKDFSLLGSFKSENDAPYLEELKKRLNNNLSITFTRKSSTNWEGFTRRIDKEMIEEVIPKEKLRKATIYICGGSVFVEDMSELLTSIEIEPSNIKKEYFG